MNELTDLEICKRIAEIEKLPHRLEEGMNDKFINASTIYGDVCEYNPLTDDALCFQLMVKYAIEVKPPLKGVQENTKVAWSVFNGIDDFDNYYLYNASTNKAICLAIIEAHKVQS